MDLGDELHFIDSSSGEKKELIELKGRKEPHGGGDWKLTEGFLNSLQPDYREFPLTNARASLESHLMAFAAEKSRTERQGINMRGFRRLV